MQRLTTEGDRGHGERGFQQSAVPHAPGSTVALDLVGVDRQHLIQRQEGRHVGSQRRCDSVGEPAKRAGVLSVEFLHDLAQTCRALLRAYR